MRRAGAIEGDVPHPNHGVWDDIFTVWDEIEKEVQAIDLANIAPERVANLLTLIATMRSPMRYLRSRISRGGRGRLRLAREHIFPRAFREEVDDGNLSVWRMTT